MTPEEALRNILILVDGSDEMEDAHSLQLLSESIKTLAEKGLGALQITFRE
jgi:Fe-S cluster assembly ATPase SufC